MLFGAALQKAVQENRSLEGLTRQRETYDALYRPKPRGREQAAVKKAQYKEERARRQAGELSEKEVREEIKAKLARRRKDARSDPDTLAQLQRERTHRGRMMKLVKDGKPLPKTKAQKEAERPPEHVGTRSLINALSLEDEQKSKIAKKENLEWRREQRVTNEFKRRRFQEEQARHRPDPLVASLRSRSKRKPSLNSKLKRAQYR